MSVTVSPGAYLSMARNRSRSVFTYDGGGGVNDVVNMALLGEESRSAGGVNEGQWHEPRVAHPPTQPPTHAVELR